MGCNKVIDSLNPEKYKVTHLPIRTKTDDGRVIGMVRVENKKVYASGGPVSKEAFYLVGEQNA